MKPKALPDQGCHNCRFWLEQTDSGDTERTGECRRYPAIVLYDQEGGVFATRPSHSPDDWCGEHQHKVH